MSSATHDRDQGIILKKRSLLNNIVRITIFSEHHGKIVLSAYGIKKINSRRLSHLETGNFLKFSFQEKDSFFSLRETETMYGYSKIKSSPEKLHTMYLIFFILNRVLPEMEPEEATFSLTKNFLKKLNNKEVNQHEIDECIINIFTLAGFIDESRTFDGVDSLDLAEKILGERIKLS
ncbi:DNA repair protein RecO [Candidatus Roizmanbacteria bacterium RIFCSPHIGHO2_02_FULL_40_9]|uniref:DNA repair protein RecO n=1 Tax=Candidatus Roizmanbacteria bacterium RIFCSPHIGHO2_02_FULL_40_9 TaxID=1802042 RepID=A0A1F7HE20_9BACT|nr:MAG: DNA repair protein RecO [Candidatus Roizmanbacteria bacterium RIFCSPHIGHO2_02_FULL_40_9]